MKLIIFLIIYLLFFSLKDIMLSSVLKLKLFETSIIIL